METAQSGQSTSIQIISKQPIKASKSTVTHSWPVKALATALYVSSKLDKRSQPPYESIRRGPTNLIQTI